MAGNPALAASVMVNDWGREQDRCRKKECGMLSKRIAIAVAIFVVALIALGRAGSVLVAWQWFRSLGYVGVFSTIFATRAALFFVVFALSTAAILLSGGLA